MTTIGIIYKTRNFFNTTTLTNLYYTFIYPYLIYCIEIWGNTNDIHLDPFKIKLKSIRAITFSHYRESTAPLFQNLNNILHFKKLVTQIIALLMFKYHNGVLPNPINNLLTVTSIINTQDKQMTYKYILEGGFFLQKTFLQNNLDNLSRLVNTQTITSPV